jgi:hypothetical protein
VYTNFLGTSGDVHFISFRENVRGDEDKADDQAEEVKLQNARVVTVIRLIESSEQVGSHRLQNLEFNCKVSVIFLFQY